jgi:hypothetical protein
MNPYFEETICTMKIAISFLLAASLLTGCKKAIEEKKADLVIQAMTNGQWIITNFVHNGTIITTDFYGYKFQYYSDKTVDALKNGLLEKKGTWDGDASTMTTWANFTDVTNPLLLINGSWNIENSGWTHVVASQNINGETKTMRLDKL